MRSSASRETQNVSYKTPVRPRRFPRGKLLYAPGLRHLRPASSSPMPVRMSSADDGSGAARIEEEVVVTKDGCEIITNFPSDRLISCGLPGCEVF